MPARFSEKLFKPIKLTHSSVKGMLPASDFFGDKTSCFFDKIFGKFYFSSVNLINFADFWKTWPIVYFTKLEKKNPVASLKHVLFGDIFKKNCLGMLSHIQ
jgi:hypothetical protein